MQCNALNVSGPGKASLMCTGMKSILLVATPMYCPYTWAELRCITWSTFIDG